MIGTAAKRRVERPDLVERVVSCLGHEVRGSRVARASWTQHSNDVGRIRLDDGRTLMVKLARFSWSAAGFRAARQAARLLRERGVVAPLHLAAPDELDGRPLLCYWRIRLPTLARLWPRLSAARRAEALRGWGALLRRVHEVRLDGCGPLSDDARRPRSLARFLAADLGERLRPAVAGEWPAALPALDAALDCIPALERALDGWPAVLLHGDVHAQNVVCRVERDRVRCVGLLDLESAAAGPRELDLAKARVLHGPLFAQPLPDGWFEELRAGYGLPLEPFATRYFALCHLLNMGFFSALIGDHHHAADVAAAADAEARALARETRRPARRRSVRALTPTPPVRRA